MARYIDADAAIRLIELDALLQFGYTKRDAIDCIKATPTADVVPKSEVEQTKAEVAREIFDELEAILNGDGFYYFFRTFKYDELKKKYTEDQT